jgi:hypothetical protein
MLDGVLIVKYYTSADVPFTASIGFSKPYHPLDRQMGAIHRSSERLSTGEHQFPSRHNSLLLVRLSNYSF